MQVLFTYFHFSRFLIFNIEKYVHFYIHRKIGTDGSTWPNSSKHASPRPDYTIPTWDCWKEKQNKARVRINEPSRARAEKRKRKHIYSKYAPLGRSKSRIFFFIRRSTLVSKIIQPTTGYRYGISST